MSNKPAQRMNNEALIRVAVWNKLRDEGYTNCMIATPLHLKTFREDGSLRVYRANKGQQRHYFLEVRRAYRGISGKLVEARKVLQAKFNRSIYFLEIRASKQTGKILIRVHE